MRDEHRGARAGRADRRRRHVAHFRIGVGLCIRHAERCHPILRAIADSFDEELGAAQAQLFVTPGRTHGFGWHYDEEDVFLSLPARWWHMAVCHETSLSVSVGVTPRRPLKRPRT